MKTTKFTEEQIAFALKQAETGTKVAEVCRKMGISGAMFYNWKKKYGGLGVSELRRLKQLEEENRQLKPLSLLDRILIQSSSNIFLAVLHLAYQLPSRHIIDRLITYLLFELIDAYCHRLVVVFKSLYEFPQLIDY